MPRSAKQILEREYDIVLSDKMEYYKHPNVAYLNTSGRIADLRPMAKVIFALCNLVDRLEQELEELKHDTKPTGSDTNPSL